MFWYSGAYISDWSEMVGEKKQQHLYKDWSEIQNK